MLYLQYKHWLYDKNIYTLEEKELHSVVIRTFNGQHLFKMQFCPKSAVLFATQMIVVLAVVTAAIINLSVNLDSNRELWISLLCSTFGYILPNPKLRRSSVKEGSPNPSLGSTIPVRDEL